MTEQPPDDWPVPIDELTPEALEIVRRSAAMVEGMGQHYRGWGRDAKAPPARSPGGSEGARGDSSSDRVLW